MVVVIDSNKATNDVCNGNESEDGPTLFFAVLLVRHDLFFDSKINSNNRSLFPGLEFQSR
jgi:hypothetical protein